MDEEQNSEPCVVQFHLDVDDDLPSATPVRVDLVPRSYVASLIPPTAAARGDEADAIEQAVSRNGGVVTESASRLKIQAKIPLEAVRRLAECPDIGVILVKPIDGQSCQEAGVSRVDAWFKGLKNIVSNLGR